MPAQPRDIYIIDWLTYLLIYRAFVNGATLALDGGMHLLSKL